MYLYLIHLHLLLKLSDPSSSSLRSSRLYSPALYLLSLRLSSQMMIHLQNSMMRHLIPLRLTLSYSKCLQSLLLHCLLSSRRSMSSRLYLLYLLSLLLLLSRLIHLLYCRYLLLHVHLMILNLLTRLSRCLLLLRRLLHCRLKYYPSHYSSQSLNPLQMFLRRSV